MTTLYQTEVKVTGGRDGAAQSDDGKLQVALQLPQSMGGNGEGTNPEQLFAAGYAACFIGAMRLVAGQEKIALPKDLAINSKVALNKCDQHGHLDISVEFDIQLPGMEQAAAEALIAKADEVCPYSRATRNNIKTRFNAVV